MTEDANNPPAPPEDDMQIRLANYSKRQDFRASSADLLERARQANALPAGEREGALHAIEQEALERAADTNHPEQLAREILYAARANRDPQTGANLDVEVKIIDPSTLNTPEEIEQWGLDFRVHPAIREGLLGGMRQGSMKMFAAYEEDGTPTGSGLLILRGPDTLPDGSENYPPELRGLPNEEDVINELGGRVPWVQNVWVNEGYRRAGISSRLVLEMEEGVKDSPGLPRVMALAVRPDNVPARKSYERTGYSTRLINHKEVFVSHLDAPHAALLMVKPL